MFTLTDNRKIGIMLTVLGLGFMMLGILLFFDSGLIAIGDILFLASFPFLVGVQSSLNLFNPFKVGNSWRGIAAFALGIVLVLCRWATVGMILQAFGLIEMFGRYVLTPNNSIFFVELRAEVLCSWLARKRHSRNHVYSFFWRIIEFLRSMPYIGPMLNAPGVRQIVDFLSGLSSRERRSKA
jgi:hypothetical protein